MVTRINFQIKRITLIKMKKGVFFFYIFFLNIYNIFLFLKINYYYKL